MTTISSSRVPTVAIEPFALTVRALCQLGLPIERLLQRARVTSVSLASGERPTVEDELRLWDAAVELSGDPSIGLRVADHLQPSALGALGYLLQNSATLEALLGHAQRYARIVDDSAQITWAVRDGVVSIDLGRLGNYAAHPAGVECLFAVALGAAQDALGYRGPVGVRFSHRRPPDLAPYRQRFGPDVRFGDERNRILVAESLLRLPAQRRDDTLARILEAHTEHLLSQLPTPQCFTEEARFALEKLVLESRTESTDLARALHVSDRTMRRRLAHEGTRFAVLLDDVRKTIVLGHVSYGNTSWDRIAELAGFGDMSAFYRAFKRWTGSTPAKYRREGRNGT